MKIKFKVRMLPVAFLALTLPVSAQFTYNSPYSRYGIGNLYQVVNAHNAAMGGLKYGINGSYLVNPSNPASYTAFKKNYFTFDAGLNGSAARLTAGSKARDEGHFNLNNLAFGVPFGDRWGGAFGLIPFSSVGYNISEHTLHPDFGGYNTIYEGNGGINRVFAGIATKIIPNLSVGINANYMFGSLNYLRTVVFDSTYYLNLRSRNSRIIHDVSFDAGLQYHHILDEARGISLTAGLMAGIPSHLSGREDVLTETFKYSGSNVVVIRDTIENDIGEEGSINLPLQLAGGLSLRRAERWMAGVDIAWQDWSGFSAFGTVDSLKPALQVALGGEYKLSTLLLRAGLRYQQSYLEIRSNQLNEVGISFGVGLPVYNKNYSVSMISIGLEAGMRGTTDDGLIKESFGRLWLGFTMSQERWFKRREYN